MKQRINVYRQFIFSPVPNWLTERPEISSGAKLTYARLAQHAGRGGECYPTQATLALELGVSPRSVRGYIHELVEQGLIESTRIGLNRANVYFFLKHSWMESRLGTNSSAPDRKDSAALDRKDSAAPSMKRYIEKRVCSSEHSPSPNEKPFLKPGSARNGSAVRAFIEFYCGKHEELRKAGYVVQWGRDGPAAKRMIDSLGLGECQARAVRYLQREDKWNLEHGFSISNMQVVINGLANGDGESLSNVPGPTVLQKHFQGA